MMKKVLNPALYLNNRLFSIEGNIGCGKSSVLDYITSKGNTNLLCVQEPITQWTNTETGTDLLKLFYEKRERWSFCFENLVQLSRLKNLNDCKNHLMKNLNQDLKIFTERSIYSSFHVFVKNSFEQNNLNKNEFDILSKYYEYFTSNQAEMPFKVIYIKSTPEVCLKRIRYRNRGSEASIDEHYLNRINSKYEDWIKNIPQSELIVIDGNLEKEKVYDQIDQNLFY